MVPGRRVRFPAGAPCAPDPAYGATVKGRHPAGDGPSPCRYDLRGGGELDLGVAASGGDVEEAVAFQFVTGQASAELGRGPLGAVTAQRVR